MRFLSTSDHAPKMVRAMHPLKFWKIIPNQCVSHINTIILDTTAPLALARDIAKSGNRPRPAKVQNQQVWMPRLGTAPLRVPEIRRLAVNRVFRRAVFISAFLAVHVG